MNLLTDLPSNLSDEVFEDLLCAEHIRIERIVSKGHSSPDDYWYNQDENEWVVVLSGEGCIEYEDGKQVTLKPGDYINIPARTKHRVLRTLPDTETVWLAIFY
ncbi:cupin domain-containing protein [Vibrio sp. S4M6]|uniref:cupin domain-containing protein n=1 Tax=Vibrio sinus TaxID=2946865 RepID=UPI002029F7E8|nr:cupin domain-containing protein [Vibrio sinus]MCL9780054.1 cupin domain-containing protein [Vibrio sinus]